MATNAALKLKAVTENLNHILAIELLAACQGIDLRSPLKTSPKLQTILTYVRKYIPFMKQDRVLSEDISYAAERVLELPKFLID